MTKRPHICFDRVLPRDVMRLQSTAGGRPGVLKALSPIGKTWMNGSTLHVRFIDGNAQQQATAKEQAK